MTITWKTIELIIMIFSYFNCLHFISFHVIFESCSWFLEQSDCLLSQLIQFKLKHREKQNSGYQNIRVLRENIFSWWKKVQLSWQSSELIPYWVCYSNVSIIMMITFDCISIAKENIVYLLANKHEKFWIKAHVSW